MHRPGVRNVNETIDSRTALTKCTYTVPNVNGTLERPHLLTKRTAIRAASLPSRS